MIFNFRFRRTLRASNQVVVGLTNRDCPAICASRPDTAYMSAAWRIGSDLTAAHPFPVVTTERFPGPSTSFNSPYDGRPARPLFSGGRVAEALHDAFLSLGRLPQHISDRAAVDEIMKIGGWKTESIA